MALRIMALLVACLLTAVSARCFGQQSEDFPASTLTREQWQHRVDDARRWSEEFAANARVQAAIPSPNQEETEATDRAMNDPTLQQGDIVATNKGFIVFVGRDEEHQPNDFRPAPNLQSPR